jgi:hypothetical protein
MAKTVVSPKYKPSDFSEGLWHEALVTLSKRGFSPEMATEVANAKSGKADEIVGLFQPSVVFASQLNGLRSFYKEFFGMDLDFSGVHIPKRVSVFDYLLIIAESLSLDKVYEACIKNFPCSRYGYEDMWLAAVRNDRSPIKHYAIWVRDIQESDEELRNLSANQISGRGIKTETLMERLIHELIYWHNTKKHLDMKSTTLCAGSRDKDGRVPCVNWCGVNMNVSCYSSSHSGDFLRARQVVS